MCLHWRTSSRRLPMLPLLLLHQILAEAEM